MQMPPFHHHHHYPVIDSELCQQLFAAYGVVVDTVLWILEAFE